MADLDRIRQEWAAQMAPLRKLTWAEKLEIWLARREQEATA